MSPADTPAEARGSRQAAAEEIGGLVIGVGFTLLLFLGMARFEHIGSGEAPAEIEELRLVSVPFEPPPPTPPLEERTPDESPPLDGLEAGTSDSPVRIAATPPDLVARMPETMVAPRASMQAGLPFTELKPKISLETDLNHVFQESEVDQMPRVLVRVPPPSIPADVRGGATSLRVNLLILIGRDGRPENVRVTESSGSARFDAMIAEAMLKGWVFSPAMKRGKRVRVLAQQPYRVVFPGGGNPFNVD